MTCAICKTPVVVYSGRIAHVRSWVCADGWHRPEVAR